MISPATAPDVVHQRQASLTRRAAIAIVLMVGFYLLALVVAVVLAVIAYDAARFGGIAGLKVAFLSASAAVVLLWSLRPRRDEFEPPGPELSRADQPELFAAIDDVARATSEAVPDVVFAVDDLNAGVSNRGGFFGFGGKRVMVLGLPLLHSVTVDQLRAILAHEFGHYGAGDTRITRIVYRARVSLGHTIEALQGRAVNIIFAWYGRMVLNVTAAVSRQQELAADQFAARATSTADMIAGLEATERLGYGFNLYIMTMVTPMLEAGRRPPICAGFVSYMRDESIREKADLLQRAFSQFHGALDSHPPLAERVAALNLAPRTASTLPDTRTASVLLRNADQLELQTFKRGDGRVLRALPPAAWSEFLSIVRYPYWKDQVQRNQQALAGLDIDAAPETAADRVALGRTLSDPSAKLMSDEDLDMRMHLALHSAACLRLLALGWTPSDEPSDRVIFRRENLSADPFKLLNRTDAPQSGGWRDFCARASLTGKLLPELTAATPPRTIDHLVKAFKDATV